MRLPGAPALASVLQKLSAHYHPPKTFLHFRTPLDLLVATILSAQCTDARVNMVTETILYPKYRTASDYASVAIEELERDVHSCGTYHVKARNIQRTCALLLERHAGEVPRTMAELTALPGVGRKTASVVLAAAFDINEGIAVDTHVQRVARRLGLSSYADPKRIELDLMRDVPQKRWRDITVLLISHGRAVCTARSRKCDACFFQDVCPSSAVRGLPDQATKGISPSQSRSARTRNNDK